LAHSAGGLVQGSVRPIAFGPVARKHLLWGAEQPVHLVARVQNWEGGSHNLLHGHTPMTLRFPTGPHFLKVLPSSNSAKPGTKPLTQGPVGNILDPNSSTCFLLSRFLMTLLAPILYENFYSPQRNAAPPGKATGPNLAR
jgi:hypothetical protein